MRYIYLWILIAVFTYNFTFASEEDGVNEYEFIEMVSDFIDDELNGFKNKDMDYLNDIEFSCDGYDHDIDGLGAYAQYYMDFQHIVSLNEFKYIDIMADVAVSKGLDKEFAVKGAWKRLKKWVLTRVKKQFISMWGIQTKQLYKDKPLHSAYLTKYFRKNVRTKMKKKWDKIMLKARSNIDENGSKFFDHFEHCVMYYHYNDSERPDRDIADRYNFYVYTKDPTEAQQQTLNQHSEQLKKVPLKVVIGCLEVGCGAIICFIPFPGCASLGYWVMSGGGALIGAGLMEMIEDSEAAIQENAGYDLCLLDNK